MTRPHRLGIATAACMLLAFCARPARAEEILSVDLALAPPSGTVNQITLTLTATVVGSKRSDSDTATVTGNVLARLTADFNAGTHEAIVTALEFTGGRYTFSAVDFDLDFGFLIGTIHAAGTGVGGTLDTPYPPGSVSGQQFPTEEHEAIIDAGTVVATGKGLVCGQLGTVTIYLADDPIAASTQQTGMLVVSAPQIQGGAATYDVRIDLPVDFDEPIYDEYAGITASAAGTGLLRAEGAFSRALPLRGDLDGSGAVDAADIDLLYDHIPSAAPSYDLDGSGAVNQADMDEMVLRVLGTCYGDANLDGRVDFLDYLTLKRHFETDAAIAPAAMGWRDGDFDGDGDVDRDDFVALRANFGFGGPAAGAIGVAPEPMAALVLLLVPLLLRRRRRAAPTVQRRFARPPSSSPGPSGRPSAPAAATAPC